MKHADSLSLSLTSPSLVLLKETACNEFLATEQYSIVLVQYFFFFFRTEQPSSPPHILSPAFASPFSLLVALCKHSYDVQQRAMYKWQRHRLPCGKIYMCWLYASGALNGVSACMRGVHNLGRCRLPVCSHCPRFHFFAFFPNKIKQVKENELPKVSTRLALFFLSLSTPGRAEKTKLAARADTKGTEHGVRGTEKPQLLKLANYYCYSQPTGKSMQKWICHDMVPPKTKQQTVKPSSTCGNSSSLLPNSMCNRQF